MWDWRKIKQSKLTWVGGIVAAYVPLSHVFNVAQMIGWVIDNSYKVGEIVSTTETWALSHPIAFDVILLCVGLGFIVLGGVYSGTVSSAFKIQFQESVAPYFEYEGDAPGYGITQICRIRVQNNTNRAIGGVRVTLQGLTPQPNALYAHSVPLRFSNIPVEAEFPSPPNPIVLDEQQGQFVDVVSYKHSSMLPACAYQLHIEHLWTNQSQIVPHDEFIFEIEVSGNGVAAYRRQFSLGFRGGKLCMLFTEKPIRTVGN